MDDILYEASKRCPKGIRNGPCGAMHEGRCELGGMCAWADAYKTLESEGKAGFMNEIAGTERYSSWEKKAGMHGLLVGGSLSGRYRPRLRSVHSPEKKSSHPFKNSFAVTTELDPPHGSKTERMKEFLDALPEVDGVNIVDNPLGKPLMSGVLPALLARKSGRTPIYQITCRARNVEAIQSDIFSAYACGVRHILALTGDYVQDGVKPVFEIDSSILAKLIKTNLAEARDFYGAALDMPLNFWVGVAANPNSTPLEPEIIKLGKKMNVADFAQTQAVFDVETLEKFANAVSFREKILIGILPLRDYAMAERISKVPGVRIPEGFISKIREDPAAGISLARDISKSAKKLGFGGIHIMPMMDADVVKKIIG